jgi:hypothetical protein
MQTHVFLEALCDEYTRCEVVFLEVLPGLFRKWDEDADGFLSMEDITRMMTHMAPQVMRYWVCVGLTHPPTSTDWVVS